MIASSRSQTRPRKAPDLIVDTLPNGLTLASYRMPGARTVAAGAFVNVGVRDEPPLHNGLSHMIEHMVFKGTATRDARQLSATVERAGASMNAYTTRESTVYHVDGLPTALPVAVETLADVVLHPAFPEHEIAQERKVITQEIEEAGDDPESLALDACDTLAFPGQALGRPILGTRRHLKTIGRVELIAHHTARYRADNLILVAAGQVEHERWAAEVEQHFAQARAGTSRGRSRREVASYVGGFRHLDDDFGSTDVLLAWLAPSRRSPEFATWALLAELLGGGASSPLFQSIREQHGLAYRVECWLDGYEDAGMLRIAAGVRPRSVARFLECLCQTLLSLTEVIDADEMARIHNQKLMSLAQRLERPMDLVEVIADDLHVHGRVRTHKETIEAMQAVDATTLRGALRGMLSQRPTLVVVGRMSLADPLAVLKRRLGVITGA